MLCSDNADCVVCLSLTSRWCSFIHILTILSPMYTFPQEQGILYTPAELSGGLRFLGFLRICPIFLEGVWKRFECSCVLIQYPADRVCCSFYEWENRKSSFAHLILWWLCVVVHTYWCVCWLFYLYLFYHIILSFLSYHFIRSFVRLVSDGWVPSVSVLCQRW